MAVCVQNSGYKLGASPKAYFEKQINLPKSPFLMVLILLITDQGVAVFLSFPYVVELINLSIESLDFNKSLR
jgi:hypothetical protein